MAGSRLPPIVRLLRPRQWYKNLLVFIPLVFSNNATNLDLWQPALVCFAAFCALASSTYCANDIVDRKRDRLHPSKRNRPIASGAIPVPAAILVCVLLLAGGLFLLARTTYAALVAGVAYLVIQVLYNAWLKHIVLWDTLTVAAGFVIRALAGTAAIDIGPPTHWLIVCTFLFAFYLALAKRRHELLLAHEDPAALEHRATLGAYTVPFLEQTMLVATALLLAAYSLYTFFGTETGGWMMFTIPFAYYGVFRYSYLVHRADIGDEAEMIFLDRATLVNGVVWVVLVVLILAGVPQDAFANLQSLDTP